MSQQIQHIQQKKIVGKIVQIVGPYQIGEVIGHGSCGKVYKALNLQNGSLVAIKQVSLDIIKEDRKGSIKTEISLLKNIEHPKIVKYLDCIQTDECLNIVLEYMENGSLDSLIKKFGKINESLAALYIEQVLAGLEFLHSKNIIHRDIKGGNILTTKEGEVKLADFSVATMINQELNSMISVQNLSFAGTPYWMAPEVIQEQTNITYACDIWSLGCTVIELLTEKPPYYDLNPWAALLKIASEKEPPIPDHLSSEVKDFLTLCFEKNPEKRSTASQLRSHKWLKNASQKKDIVLKLNMQNIIQNLNQNEAVMSVDNVKSEKKELQDESEIQIQNIKANQLQLQNVNEQSKEFQSINIQNQNNEQIQQLQKNIQTIHEAINQILLLLKSAKSTKNQQDQEQQRKDLKIIYQDMQQVIRILIQLIRRQENYEEMNNELILESVGTLRLIEILRFSLQQNESKQQNNLDYEKLQVGYSCMQLINLICDDVPSNYIQLCLSGIITQLKSMAFYDWNITHTKMESNELLNEQISRNDNLSSFETSMKELKVEIAYFILKSFVTCNEAVQMIFACEGYKILTEFLKLENFESSDKLQQSFEKNKLLIFMAIDVYLLHFNPLLQNYLPNKVVLQEIFLNEDVHIKLILILESMMKKHFSKDINQNDEEIIIAQKYIEKIYDLLFQLYNKELIYKNDCQFQQLGIQIAESLIQNIMQSNQLQKSLKLLQRAYILLQFTQNSPFFQTQIKSILQLFKYAGTNFKIIFKQINQIIKNHSNSLVSPSNQINKRNIFNQFTDSQQILERLFILCEIIEKIGQIAIGNNKFSDDQNSKQNMDTIYEISAKWIEILEGLSNSLTTSHKIQNFILTQVQILYKIMSQNKQIRQCFFQRQEHKQDLIINFILVVKNQGWQILNNLYEYQQTNIMNNNSILNEETYQNNSMTFQNQNQIQSFQSLFELIKIMHILLFKGIDECYNGEDDKNNSLKSLNIKEGRHLDTDIVSDDSNDDKQITFKELSQKEFQSNIINVKFWENYIHELVEKNQSLFADVTFYEEGGISGMLRWIHHIVFQQQQIQSLTNKNNQNQSDLLIIQIQDQIQHLLQKMILKIEKIMGSQNQKGFNKFGLKINMSHSKFQIEKKNLQNMNQISYSQLPTTNPSENNFRNSNQNSSQLSSQSQFSNAQINKKQSIPLTNVTSQNQPRRIKNKFNNIEIQNASRHFANDENIIVKQNNYQDQPQKQIVEQGQTSQQQYIKNQNFNLILLQNQLNEKNQQTMKSQPNQEDILSYVNQQRSLKLQQQIFQDQFYQVPQQTIQKTKNNFQDKEQSFNQQNMTTEQHIDFNKNNLQTFSNEKLLNQPNIFRVAKLDQSKVQNQYIQQQIPINHQRKSTQQEGQKVVRYIMNDNKNYIVVQAEKGKGGVYNRDRNGGVVIDKNKFMGMSKQKINQDKADISRKGQRAARNNFQSMNVFNIANCDSSIIPVQNINQGIAITEFNDREDEDEEDEFQDNQQDDSNQYEEDLILMHEMPQAGYPKIYQNTLGKVCIIPNQYVKKKIGNQKIQYQDRLQRPLVTEPVGFYGKTPSFNLVNIEEGEESVHDQTQDDQSEIEQLFYHPQKQLGQGNFVYEKTRKISKNNQNIRDDIGCQKLVRNKSRDGIQGKRLMTDVQVNQQHINHNKKRLSGNARFSIIKSQEQLNNQAIYINQNDINQMKFDNQSQMIIDANNQVHFVQHQNQYPNNQAMQQFYQQQQEY